MAEPEKKVMDVAKPEDAKTDIGGKPMIIGHKSMASDPMVREQASADPEKQTEQQTNVEAPSLTQKIIEPPVAEPKVEEKVAPKTVESEKTPPSPAVVSEKAAPVESQESAKEPATAETKIDPSAEAMEREDRVRKIIESKEYRVDIKQAKGTSKGKVWLLIALLILSLGALFYFVDTDRIDLGFNLPFSVFNDKNQGSTAESTEVPTQNQDEESEQKEKQTAETSSAEEEKIAYTNDSFGVSFSYPISWGTVGVEQIKGYSDQSYNTEIPYFLDVTFSSQKDVSLRIINGRAFEGGRGFEGALASVSYFDSFVQPYAFAFEKKLSDTYNIIRPSNEDVLEDLSLPVSNTDFEFTLVGSANDTLLMTPQWTLESLGLLPWDSIVNTETQTEVEATLASLRKTVYLIRNFESANVLGINAEYSWKDAEDELVTEQLIDIISSIK